VLACIKRDAALFSLAHTLFFVIYGLKEVIQTMRYSRNMVRALIVLGLAVAPATGTPVASAEAAGPGQISIDAANTVAGYPITHGANVQVYLRRTVYDKRPDEIFAGCDSPVPQYYYGRTLLQQFNCAGVRIFQSPYAGPQRKLYRYQYRQAFRVVVREVNHAFNVGQPHGQHFRVPLKGLRIVESLVMNPDGTIADVPVRRVVLNYKTHGRHAHRVIKSVVLTSDGNGIVNWADGSSRLFPGRRFDL
jgi:hypothetical protein